MERPPIGIGAIISDTISLFAANLVKFVILIAIPTVSVILLKLLLGLPLVGGGSATVGSVVSQIFDQLGSYIATGLVTLAAFDAKLGREGDISKYINALLLGIVPIIVLAIVVALAVGIGLILLILPGLYLMAMFSVFVQAILIEKAGFRGLARSIELTEGHRWGILGLFAIVFLIMLVVGIALGGIGLALGTAGFVVIAIIIGIVGNGLNAVMSALVYARLREIKDGLGMQSLATVFE